MNNDVYDLDLIPGDLVALKDPLGKTERGQLYMNSYDSVGRLVASLPGNLTVVKLRVGSVLPVIAVWKIQFEPDYSRTYCLVPMPNYSKRAFAWIVANSRYLEVVSRP